MFGPIVGFSPADCPRVHSPGATRQSAPGGPEGRWPHCIAAAPRRVRASNITCNIFPQAVAAILLRYCLPIFSLGRSVSRLRFCFPLLFSRRAGLILLWQVSILPSVFQARQQRCFWAGREVRSSLRSDRKTAAGKKEAMRRHSDAFPKSGLTSRACKCSPYETLPGAPYR